MGERLHGMQEVGGSIPPGSTNYLTIFGICLNELRGNRLPLGHPVTILHAVSGHHVVTRKRCNSSKNTALDRNSTSFS
jgi:hypothetical protein